jgi:triosephosphate isomerase (TIM)
MSQRKKLIAGNWKMYKNFAETRAFLRAVHAREAEFRGSELVVFPQAPLLSLIGEEWEALSQPASGSWFSFGPQNIYWEEKGAYTGELSPALAKELKCRFALAGHSERRQFFGETHEGAVKRALAAHAFGMKAVFCVGEMLAERDAGKTFEVLKAQCAPLFAQVKTMPKGFNFAYEPVWAIGTGRTATAAQAQEAHHYLRGLVSEHWGPQAAAAARILYGGSVKPENSKELMSQADVDGVLVGGASLEAASFLAIAAAGKEC